MSFTSCKDCWDTWCKCPTRPCAQLYANELLALSSMEVCLMHMAAGFRLEVEALGDDGSDGYTIRTECRKRNYIEETGKSISDAAVLVANKLIGVKNG